MFLNLNRLFRLAKIKYFNKIFFLNFYLKTLDQKN